MRTHHHHSFYPIVMITGTSSGIGFELIKILAREKFRVVATALPKSVQQVRDAGFKDSDQFKLFDLDISDFNRQKEVVREVQKRWGDIEILINNAGISYRSVIEDMSSQSEAHQMAVNFSGPMHLTRLVLEGMRKVLRGRIVNVSSVGGMMAMPTMGYYSASKWALEGATEALWFEMKPWNIHVSLVQPGFINSLAFKKVFYSDKKGLKISTSPYASYYENMTQFISFFMKHALFDSKDVAKVIYKTICKKDPNLRIHGTPDAFFFYYLRRILPARLFLRLLYCMLPKRKDWVRK